MVTSISINLDRLIFEHDVRMVLLSHSTLKSTVLSIDKVCTKITKTLTGTNIIALILFVSLSAVHDKVRNCLESGTVQPSFLSIATPKHGQMKHNKIIIDKQQNQYSQYFNELHQERNVRITRKVNKK